MFSLFLIAVAVVIIGLIVFVAMQPTDFRITRSIAISAPVPVVFAQVNDLRLWEAWSPWDKIDPAVKKTFEGPSSGVGASYSWVGDKTGEGRMTTIECRPNELIRFQLDFVKPFKATNIAEFTFKPQDRQTVVTWSMDGKNNFMTKAFGLIMNCDKMIGGEFEKGLMNLKAVAETTIHP